MGHSLSVQIVSFKLPETKSYTRNLPLQDQQRLQKFYYQHLIGSELTQKYGKSFKVMLKIIVRAGN